MLLPQGQPLGKALFKFSDSPRAQGIGSDFVYHGLFLHVTGETTRLLPLLDAILAQNSPRGKGRGAVSWCGHAVRATAATNALAHNADIATVQEWLGHANMATTRLDDRRQSRPEESPTFTVEY